MTLDWSQHLIVAPVLVPLLVAALLVPLNETRHQLKFLINASAVAVQFGIALMLVSMTDSGHWQDGIGVYLAANWAAPFGIALVVDRLAALMLLLTALLAACALLYSMMRWSRIGVHYHSLFQFMLMGLNGAFLTHDLFNLFVFFEVMLAASYGLLLHGYNLKRIRAGMQFIAVNLVASLMFLIGLALIYAAAGTLNMADLAMRLEGLGGDQLALLKTGAGILAIAFLIKSAMWPLGFWLPITYAAASPPVAAMFVLMTKVGVYVVLRLWLLLFSGDSHDAAGFGADVLLWGGMATIVFGAAGMFASDRHGDLAGYGAIMSSGTLLALIGLGESGVVGAALFYLLSSTLGMGAFMLLIELVERSRNPVEAMLSLTREAFEFEETPDQPVGVGIPAALAFIGLSFGACALVITGLPPLSGFVAKFSVFHALLAGEVRGAGLAVMGLVILSGLAAIIALMRFGVRTFWASGAINARMHLSEVVPVSVLLFLCVFLTLRAGPMLEYLERTSATLHQPQLYAQRVLSEPVAMSASAQQGRSDR